MSAKIITIESIKGGEGKSLIACHLVEERYNVLLVDADDQGTSQEFSKIRAEHPVGQYTCVTLFGSSVRNEVLKLRSNYDLIVIDVGGRDTTSQRAAISIADLFIVPVPPASESLWTFNKLINVIKEMMAVNPAIKAYTFLNKADHQGKDNIETIEFLKSIEYLKYLDVVLGNRRAFRNAVSQGLAINELKSRAKDNKAIKEFNKLYFNVKRILKLYPKRYSENSQEDVFQRGKVSKDH